MQLSINQLIEQAAAGDEQAQQEVYNHFRGAAIRKYRKKGFTCDIDDYLSAVYEGVWEGITTLDKSKMTNIDAKVWLFIVVRAVVGEYIRTISTVKTKINTFADRLDRPTRLTMHEKPDVQVFLRDLIPDKADIENVVVDRLTIQEVLSGFTANLSQLEREVLYLQDLGYGLKDTAKVLGVKPKSVDNALTRIRNKANKMGIREQLA